MAGLELTTTLRLIVITKRKIVNTTICLHTMKSPFGLILCNLVFENQQHLANSASLAHAEKQQSMRSHLLSYVILKA